MIFQGKNVRISVEGKTIYHATSCKLDISMSLEEIATKDTEGSVNTPGNYTWNASTDALFATLPSGDTTHKSADEILDYLLAKTELDFEFSTNQSGLWVYAGKVYVESASIDATVGQSVTGSFTFKGNGDLSKTLVPSPNPVMTSSDVVNIENGVSGSFQVTADNGPLTSFGITGSNSLPTNVSLDTDTGLISWTNSVAVGTYTVQLLIFNSAGWVEETITFEVV